ncbi:MAG: hypothetical protein IT384_28135 [Deltaproteobacteria bacterium]|nr:hypothetical protein [Deltaproteobacteria bacterium]
MGTLEEPQRGTGGVMKSIQRNVAALMLSLLPVSAFAAEAGEAGYATVSYRTVPFNLSIFAPLDLNPGVGRVRNHITLGLFLSSTDQLHGVEIGAGVGLVKEDVLGAQIDALACWSEGSVRGVQLSSLFSYTGAITIGWQGSAVLNASGAVIGAQVGTANLTAELMGTQIGVVNWSSRGRGFQLGVVNLSDELDGEAIGVFSWSKRRGVFDAEVWSADTGLLNAGVRFGTEHIYNLFFVSVASTADTAAWAPGYGLGAHLPITERFSLDLDFTMQAPNVHARIRDGQVPDVLYSIRVAPALQLTETLALFGGPSLHFLHDSGPSTASSLVPSYAWQLTAEGGTDHDRGRVHAWLGAFVGLRAF